MNTVPTAASTPATRAEVLANSIDLGLTDLGMETLESNHQDNPPVVHQVSAAVGAWNARVEATELVHIYDDDALLDSIAVRPQWIRHATPQTDLLPDQQPCQDLSGGAVCCPGSVCPLPARRRAGLSAALPVELLAAHRACGHPRATRPVLVVMLGSAHCGAGRCNSSAVAAQDYRSPTGDTDAQLTIRVVVLADCAAP